jgi:hypothetical protein
MQAVQLRTRSSKLQRLVTLSTEAEFIAASEVAKELLWLTGELGGKGSEVPTLYVDNASAVKLAKNPVS